MPLSENIKNIAIIGLGISGKAAAQFLLKKNYSVWGCDQKADLKDLLEMGLKQFSENENLPENLDLVIISPGISPSHHLYKEVKTRQIEIIGEIELACRYLKNPLLGITGTNGKTTATLLTAHILNECGKPALALGNIGTPLISQVEHLPAHQIVVAELSSYQLETMTSPVIDAGAILNITPDHLDRYDSLEVYAQSKIQMTRNLKPYKPLFVFDAIWHSFSELFGNFQPLLYGHSTECHFRLENNTLYWMNKQECLFPSHYLQHDLENIVASYALCREMGITSSEFLQALSSFQKPAHRIEFVRTFNEIDFYNDSKGTNLDAVIRAVQSLQKPIVLIAGGIDKGASYTAWIPLFDKKVKGICTIGQAAEKIQQELSGHLPVHRCHSLEAAIHTAIKMASPGEAILLSPGCASQDMFRDYAHRGDVFKAFVNAL